MKRLRISLFWLLLLPWLVACPASPRGDLDRGVGYQIPLDTDWSHTPIKGEVLDRQLVDESLINLAIEDAKSELKKSVSFYKAIRIQSGDVEYIFSIERVDDSFLVYEKEVSGSVFARKYFHNQLYL